MLKALFLTIIVGIFFVMGIFIPKLFKNKQKLILITTSLTFVIMLSLLFLDLLPEIIEIFDPLHNLKSFSIMILSILLGITILKLLDCFIPEHHHEHHEKNDNELEHNSHMFHIGFITSISLVIHNILEGISIYATGINDFKLGLIMALTVGAHNLPLGIEVAVSLEANKKSKILKFIIFFLLIFSSFFGGFLLFIIGKELSEVLEGILLSITFGMLTFISLMELLPEIKTNKNTKELKVGLLLGILLTLILCLI